MLARLEELWGWRPSTAPRPRPEEQSRPTDPAPAQTDDRASLVVHYEATARRGGHDHPNHGGV